MIVFALDSSSRAASAAILKDGVLLAESYADVGLTHSETLMPLCNEVFRRAALAPAEIDYFAAGAGPGSFTGLRIGLGILKGLALPFGAPCVAVSSLEAAAQNGCDTWGGVVAAVFDARQNRVYNAAFRFTGGAPERLWADSVDEIPLLQQRLAALAQPVLLVGDAAAICYNIMKDALRCAPASPALVNVRASGVAGAALRYIERGEVVSPERLAPAYMQLPQAERERLKKQNANGESQ